MEAANGDPLPDGVVGRAVDRAIDDIMPYVIHGDGGWYNTVVAPKL